MEEELAHEDKRHVRSDVNIKAYCEVSCQTRKSIKVEDNVEALQKCWMLVHSKTESQKFRTLKHL